jgi:hypothetical protein
LDLDPHVWERSQWESRRSYMDVLQEECLQAPGVGHLAIQVVEDALAVSLKLGWPGRLGQHVLVEEHRYIFQAYKLAMRQAANPDADPVEVDETAAFTYASKLDACQGRRLAWLDNSTICLVPGITKSSDVCLLIPGLSAPFVVRPTGEPDQYWLLGDCYVYEGMDGVLFETLRATKAPEHEFIIS